MKPEEYVTTIVYNGKMINIGLDDYGQQYFLEYMNDDGHLTEIGCGSYSSGYNEVIEAIWGKPTECEHYGFGICTEHIYSHGYCSRCPYNTYVIDRNVRMRNKK